MTERPQKGMTPAPSPPPRPLRNERLLFPTLTQGAEPDALLLTAEPMQSWPLLLDTANATPNEDYCCWPPPLEPPFRERWADMPTTWFFSALKMELKP